MKHHWFFGGLWGVSVAMSWMWGLGLFFSVQFTHQFGLFGLLTFAVPNALGLVLFGLLTGMIARRGKGSEALAVFFQNWSRPFRLIFFLYQLLALTLTMFAIIRYLWMPLNLEPEALYLPLTILVVGAAGILFGEEFDIKRIKFSHGVLFLIAAGAIAGLVSHAVSVGGSWTEKPVTAGDTGTWPFWGYVIPLIIGLLLGPWLDLQQWQRAIQIHRENLSVGWSYFCGALLFFALLLFHGTLALWATGHGSASWVTEGRFDGQSYAQGMLSGYFFSLLETSPWVFTAYATWISVCILTTLDSGYVALRWFLSQNLMNSKSAIWSLVPGWLVTSPIPTFIFAALFTLFAVLVGLELEYFMIFYATFFVGYAALSIARAFSPAQANAMPQIKMFCIGSLAVVIFAYGYFLKLPAFQILGSLLPLGYVIWLMFKPGSAQEFVTGTDELEAPASPGPVAVSAPAAPAVSGSPMVEAATGHGHSPSGHFEGKWFVHSFVATYADTNSVGNVYFGMYAMWVGKTRELFFNKCLPKFNLKTTPYYILTRSFEHKFMHETREFEEVRVKIRVASFNRKFAYLEHEIYDSANRLLGKGEQSLMFVSASDYGLIDIPQEVHNGFLPYI
jgi:acyl-CoA thioesterase FadM